MKKLGLHICAGLAAVVLVALPLTARADDTQPTPKGGTLKGAAVGGVAGHMMGGHAKTGADVGAIAGHHEKVKSQQRIDAGGKP